MVSGVNGVSFGTEQQVPEKKKTSGILYPTVGLLAGGVSGYVPKALPTKDEFIRTLQDGNEPKFKEGVDLTPQETADFENFKTELAKSQQLSEEGTSGTPAETPEPAKPEGTAEPKPAAEAPKTLKEQLATREGVTVEGRIAKGTTADGKPFSVEFYESGNPREIKYAGNNASHVYSNPTAKRVEELMNSLPAEAKVQQAPKAAEVVEQAAKGAEAATNQLAELFESFKGKLAEVHSLKTAGIFAAVGLAAGLIVKLIADSSKKQS